MGTNETTSLPRFRALLLTAAAAALAQSCADGAADIPEIAQGPTNESNAAIDPCPAGSTLAQVAIGEIHCRLSGVLETDVHLSAEYIYQLSGRVQIGQPLPAQGGEGAGPTLRIDPGVKLYAADRGAALIIARGARILAEGTQDAPIVFTSAYDLGYDDELGLRPRARRDAPRGEWGGLLINGRAAVAGADGVAGAHCLFAPDVPLAGVCEREGEGGSGPFGGDQGAADDSGALSHVHIRFAGAYAASAQNGMLRLPALALQGVGAGTRVADVTIANALGDGVRLIGGDVGLQRVAVIGAGDDGVDWSLGYRGVLQSVVVTHDHRLGDADNGFEGAQGDALEDVALVASTAARPANPRLSAPVLRDVTVFGDPEISNAGILLHRGTDVTIDGAVLTGGFATAALDIDDDATYARIAAAQLRGLVLDRAAGQALAADFDDATLPRLFAAATDSRVAPVTLTLAEALADPDPAAPGAESAFAAREGGLAPGDPGAPLAPPDSVRIAAAPALEALAPTLGDPRFARLTTFEPALDFGLAPLASLDDAPGLAPRAEF